MLYKYKNYYLYNYIQTLMYIPIDQEWMQLLIDFILGVHLIGEEITLKHFKGIRIQIVIFS